MAASLPPVPGSLKTIQHYLKTAGEHDKRDPVVAYYCRVYALQRGMELDKSSTEARSFLLALMDLAENEKQQLAAHESVSSEIVGQSHVENYALKLFLYADNEDRAGKFGKNVVKSFYTAGMLFDILTQFGELAENIEDNRKYAKWKAAYIHNCLKNGEVPHAGPLDEEEETDLEGATAGPSDYGAGPSGGAPPMGFPQPGLDPTQPHPSPSTHYAPTQPPVQPPTQPGVQYPAQPPAQPYQAPAAVPAPTPAQPAATWTPPPNPAGVTLTSQEYQKALKLCKFASSALQYEDSKTAIDNLTKALKLLTTGQQ